MSNKRKGKKWVADLGNIIMNKALSETEKNRLIIEHLGKVKNDDTYKGLKETQTKFGFNYNFEYG